MYRGPISQGRLPARIDRPYPHRVGGVKWTSPQARGLVAWYPLWERAGSPQKDSVRGQMGTVFNAAPTSSFDRFYGPVGKGGGDGNGAGTTRAYQFANLAATQVASIVPSPWAYSFWFNADDNTAQPQNIYLMQYTVNGGTFPGTAISIDTSSTLACNTNGTALVDVGFKSTKNVLDAAWHHCLFTQVPSGNANTYDSTNTYYIDGALDSTSALCCQAGAVATGDLFFLGDDQSDPPFSGRMFDFRIYRGTKTLNDAKHLYNPDTRWDLYADVPAVGGKPGQAKRLMIRA